MLILVCLSALDIVDAYISCVHCYGDGCWSEDGSDKLKSCPATCANLQYVNALAKTLEQLKKYLFRFYAYGIRNFLISYQKFSDVIRNFLINQKFSDSIFYRLSIVK